MDYVGGVTVTEEEVTEISDVQEDEYIPEEEEEMVTIWSPEASENIELNSTPELVGQQGGGVYTQNTAINGLTYFMNSGNIDAGTFRLYGLKK